MFFSFPLFLNIFLVSSSLNHFEIKLKNLSRTFCFIVYFYLTKYLNLSLFLSLLYFAGEVKYKSRFRYPPMPARKGLLAPQNTFLDTIATRFDGTRKFRSLQLYLFGIFFHVARLKLFSESVKFHFIEQKWQSKWHIRFCHSQLHVVSFYVTIFPHFIEST